MTILINSPASERTKIMTHRNSPFFASLIATQILVASWTHADVSYEKDVAPVLAKYCVGCHNDNDAEGNLSLESFGSIQNGGEQGPAIVAGNAEASRLIRMVTGDVEPKMPPEDEPAPNKDEIAILKQWTAEGAKGPSGEALRVKKLITPKLTPSQAPRPITALAISPDGSTTAIARYKSIELINNADETRIAQLDGHVGKINSLRFVGNQRLIAASGITGLRGEIIEWDTKTLETVRRIEAHRDIISAAIPSPDGKLIASAGYDREISIWNRKTGEPIRQFQGHNGAIFDLAFSPDGKIIASASADATIKIWDVASGTRLDTLSQPLKEQYSVAISPDGQFVYACGADNRIRKWQLISIDQPKINPLLIARFGHEQSVDSVRLTSDGKIAITTSADRKVKVWDTETLTELRAFTDQSDSVQAIAIDPKGTRASLGRMDGSLEWVSLDVAGARSPNQTEHAVVAAKSPSNAAETPESFTDIEPNNDPMEAQTITLPARVTGDLAGTDSDVDLFRFDAKSGEQWIFELNAADDSPLDAHVSILHEDGRPVLRTRLQAVRDSYFTFRGKDSNGTGDFRVHNWREMQLNQFLYAAGEVVKLYHYPRGPDSGFNVYPNFGSRHGYFDTTPVAHALGSPCYIVEPRNPNEAITPNGLPVFPVYYENDDASDRSSGSNSRLTFTAPSDGTFLVSARDVRGFSGETFKYALVARRPEPDFEVSIGTKDPKVPLGGGKKIDFKLKRIDGFAGEVRIDITGLPNGFATSNPITFERDHLRAWAVVTATPDAKLPAQESTADATITATAMIDGKEFTKEIGTLGKLQIVEKPKLHVSLTATDDAPNVLVIEPGTTVTANLKIVRNDHKGPIKFGSEEALVNTPHGIYVDNIGLNGVLIPEGQTERTIYITAEPWVEPTERWIFIQAEVTDNPTSYPILLRVVPRSDLAQQTTSGSK